MVLTRERVQEARRRRGRARPHDAQGRRPSCVRAPSSRSAAARPRTCSATSSAASVDPLRRDLMRREVDRARRAAGLGPTFPIAGYDDLTAAQVTRASATSRPPSCARCATTSAATRTASRCSRRSSTASIRRRPAACHPGSPDVHAPAPSSARPARGAELDLDVDSARLRRQRRRAPRRLRRLRRRRHPRRPRARAVSPRASAPTPRRARSRSSSPRRTASRRVADHPGAPWQVLPYERQLEVKAEQVDDALRAHRPPRGLRARADRAAPSSSGATATSSSTRSAPARTASSSAASTRPAASTRSCRSTTACSPPSAATPRASRCSPWCREHGPVAPGTAATQRGPPAQPRRARGPAHRRSSRSASSPPRASSPVDALADAVDCEGLFWTQTDGLGESTARRRDRAAGRRAAAARGARRPALPDLARGVLPDQHRDGRGALRRRGRVRRPARPRARLRPLLRHRHDRADRSPPARARSSGVEIVEEAVADAIENARAQRDHERALLRRRHPPGDARARRAGGPPRRLRRSTRRAPGLSQKVVRRDRSRRRRERIVYVSCNPTTLAPNAAQLVEAG